MKRYKYWDLERRGLETIGDTAQSQQTQRKEDREMSWARNQHAKTRVAAVTVRGTGRGGPNPRRPVFHAMANPNFRLEDLAYGKLILHALKYPHQTVNGVFIGSTQPSGVVVIEDAVPLQHHWTNLNPMMEVGLGLVRSAVLLFLCLSSSVFCVN